MKFLRSASLVVLSLCFGELALGAIDGSLSVTTGSGGDLRVVVQHDFHLLYGCAYPMTYVLEIPAGSSGLEVSRRYRSSDAWTILPEKLATDLFNGIEAVRFDYPAARAYVSAAFAGDADSLFLQVTGSGGTPVVPVYHGVSSLRSVTLTPRSADRGMAVRSVTPSSSAKAR